MNRKQRRSNTNLKTVRKVRRPFVAIGIPSKEFWYKTFGISFGVMLCSSFHHVDMDIIDQDSPILPFSRNRMVYKAKEMGADYLFMLDCDEVIARQALIKLLALNKDIAVADYPKRTKPYPGVNPDPLPGEDGDIVKLPWAATGCMLIKMSVFDKIEFPWFLSGYDEKQNEFGEDQYFTKKAIESGYEVWCDRTIKIGHTGMETRFL